jgi:hypothetical protein
MAVVLTWHTMHPWPLSTALLPQMKPSMVAAWPCKTMALHGLAWPCMALQDNATIPEDVLASVKKQLRFILA